MRQHVNPLSRFFQLPLDLPGPQELFEQDELPIHLDIGSARGKFLINLACLKPDWNHLGVEIRLPLVNSANRDIDQLGIRNIRFLFCNANVSLDAWLSELGKDRLQRVSIQFPDPWFKKKHHKRRVLQPSLLLSLASAMEPGRELFIQSDLLDVIEPMNLLIDMCGCFQQSFKVGSKWLEESPFPVMTEREIYAVDKGLKVYRSLYYRNHNSIPPLSDLEDAFSKRQLIVKNNSR